MERTIQALKTTLIVVSVILVITAWITGYIAYAEAGKVAQQLEAISATLVEISQKELKVQNEIVIPEEAIQVEVKQTGY